MIGWLKQCAHWLLRIGVWLGKAYPVWLAVVPVPTVILLCWYIIPDWELGFRIEGILFQLLGLVTVAYGLRDTRKLFNLPSVVDSVRQWVEGFPRFYRHFHIAAGTGEYKLEGASVAGFGRVSTSPTASLEERLSALEKNLNQTNLFLQQLKKEMEEQQRKQGDAIITERTNRELADEHIRKLLQEAMAGGLHLEWIGVVWLFTGIILGGIPDLARLFTIP